MPIIKSCTHGNPKIGGCKGCKKIYAKKEHENLGLYLWRAARSRAKAKGLPFTITPEQVVIPAHCIVLGIPLDSRDRDHCPSLDEVVQGLGYTERNTCVISGRANRIKSDASPEELRAITRYSELRSKFSLHGIPESW
jgi:hypothetical protein